MKILFIASECAPIVKVGGLADVVGSLPNALKKLGINVSVVIPFYPSIKIKDGLKLREANVPLSFGGRKEAFDLWQTYLPFRGAKNKNLVPLYLVKNDKFFSPNVYFEKDASSAGNVKEAASFFFLSAAGVKAAEILKPDVLHCHDWHTALAAYLVRAADFQPKTVLTIHNLEYQGSYARRAVKNLLAIDGRGLVNCLKIGILNADLITTVSPTYAKEILTKEFGAGLESCLRKRQDSLAGILNGLDDFRFNPQSDPALKSRYSFASLERKLENKTFLQKRLFGKVRLEIPVLGIISRLADQKGLELIMKIFDRLMEKDLQFVLLGRGADAYEKFFEKRAKKLPQKFSAKIGFNENFAHQIYAGADMFLMPSRFEPCGLGQQIAMKYGTVPIGRATGGIKDTVKSVVVEGGKAEGTGFLFKKYDPSEFFRAIEKALDLFDNKKIWRQIQINGMRQDFSWEKSAKTYVSLYKKLIK